MRDLCFVFLSLYFHFLFSRLQLSLFHFRTERYEGRGGGGQEKEFGDPFKGILPRQTVMMTTGNILCPFKRKLGRKESVGMCLFHLLSHTHTRKLTHKKLYACINMHVRAHGNEYMEPNAHEHTNTQAFSHIHAQNEIPGTVQILALKYICPICTGENPLYNWRKD